MRASDVMTTNVITVSPEMSVQSLAGLLGRYGISGVPVVDATNTLVGIVSEGDLLFRAETHVERRKEPRRSRWFDIFTHERDAALDYIKTHGRCVGEIMTRQVTTVTETTELSEIANLLESNRIKRVPVVRDGKVIGIVSRATLVRVVAAAKNLPTAIDMDDSRIRELLLTEFRNQAWAKIWAEDIIVRDKIVHIWCSDDRPEVERRALKVAAENTPGVMGVEEHLVPVPIIPML